MTTTRTLKSVSRPYDGAAFRYLFSDGDWVEFGAHADNPSRTWFVGKRSTIYGGRAVCEDSSWVAIPGDLPSGQVGRNAADALVIQFAALFGFLTGF